MKIKIKWYFVLFCISSIFFGFLKNALAEGETILARPSVNGKLQVNGRFLKDEQGNIVQLKGISTHGIAWFPDYINRECFEELSSDWGANIIRFAIYTDENNGYCTDGNKEYLKKLIDQGIEYATESDMYAVIDWHVLHDQNPNKYKDEAKVFFEEVSQKYAAYNNVIYEICNEPNGNVTWQQIKEYANEVIPIIRENDEDAIIIVGTPNWSQFVDQAAAEPIIGYDNIMYALHFYAATHKDELRAKMVAALENDLPIIVSEYGICDASGSGGIDYEQAEKWKEAMDENQVSYIAWNLSNKEETSALIKSACTKYSNFTLDDLSMSGIWIYEMLSGKEHIKTSEKNIEKETKTRIINQWTSEGKWFYQYETVVINDTKEEIEGWDIKLEFNEEFTLSDGWNGEYIIDGNTLIIKNKDYNKNIASGATVGDIGFIISGSELLELR